MCDDYDLEQEDNAETYPHPLTDDEYLFYTDMNERM